MLNAKRFETKSLKKMMMSLVMSYKPGCYPRRPERKAAIGPSVSLPAVPSRAMVIVTSTNEYYEVVGSSY